MEDNLIVEAIQTATRSLVASCGGSIEEKILREWYSQIDPHINFEYALYDAGLKIHRASGKVVFVEMIS